MQSWQKKNKPNRIFAQKKKFPGRRKMLFIICYLISNKKCVPSYCIDIEYIDFLKQQASKSLLISLLTPLIKRPNKT